MLSADLVTLSYSEGHSKYEIIVEAPSVYNQGRYERNWLNSLRVM